MKKNLPLELFFYQYYRIINLDQWFPKIFFCHPPNFHKPSADKHNVFQKSLSLNHSQVLICWHINTLRVKIKLKVQSPVVVQRSQRSCQKDRQVLAAAWRPTKHLKNVLSQNQIHSLAKSNSSYKRKLIMTLCFCVPLTSCWSQTSSFQSVSCLYWNESRSSSTWFEYFGFLFYTLDLSYIALHPNHRPEHIFV